MARLRGTFNLDANYDVVVKRPIDARMLVPTYADLTIKDNWYATDDFGNPTTSLVAFNGMLVAVADKLDVEHSGLYMLFDTNAKKNPNVELEDNWIKIGETSDIGDFLKRITDIEAEIDALKNRVTALEEDSDVEVFGYRNSFPAQGVANKLYVAADEEKSYVWLNNDYLPVGGEPSQPEVIFGGTAD